MCLKMVEVIDGPGLTPRLNQLSVGGDLDARCDFSVYEDDPAPGVAGGRKVLFAPAKESVGSGKERLRK